MSGRVESVDALRAFALMGIAVVNMPFLAGPFGVLPDAGIADQVARFTIALLFQGKFFLLFAFLFGWGVGVQEASANRSGQSFAPRYFRRQLGLLLIGLMHGIFVFAGDILVTYALVGVLLFAVRARDPAGLLRLAAVSLVVAMLVLILLAVIVGDGKEAVTTIAGPGYLGVWIDSLSARLHELPAAFFFILMFNGPMVFAAFCAGLAASRTGFLTLGNPRFAQLHRYRWVFLTVGLIANLPFALTGMNAGADNPLVTVVGFASLAFAAPILSLAYLLFVASWTAGRPASSLTSAGQMSLTAYVGEGIVAGFIFNGYGLGLYGQLGTAAVAAIALGVYIVVELLCALWARFGGQGPLERLLRLFNYERRPFNAPSTTGPADYPPF
jgi:uncharacterized protein